MKAICLGREAPRQFRLERVIAWRPVLSSDVLAPAPVNKYERGVQLGIIEAMRRRNATAAKQSRWNFHFDQRTERRGGMPRNMSFMMTTKQIRRQTKTVTRRLGWKFLEVGDELNACVKCQGLKKGETVKRICRIRVIGFREERLSLMVEDPCYGKQESQMEGFPKMSGKEFVEMFCQSMRCEPEEIVTRIEFEYLEDDGDGDEA
ncbi:MAG: hypothetical protein AAFP69_05125 [Planctomycetota bacterium]